MKRPTDVFACASANVRNATAVAEYAALQRVPRQRVPVCVCSLYPRCILRCVCVCVRMRAFLRVYFRAWVSVAGVRASGHQERETSRTRRAPQMRPQFHRGKTWRCSFTITLEIRESIRNADRLRCRRRATCKLRLALVTVQILKIQREEKITVTIRRSTRINWLREINPFFFKVNLSA